MERSVSMSKLRVAGRLANAFVLDLVKLGGHRRDVVDALLRAAIIHSNLSYLSRDADFQRFYATADADPPDELRRPASINAIATSLRLPFETVRRRVRGLAEAGVCRLTPTGVIVARLATSSPPYKLALTAQYEALQVLYGRLRAIGALKDPPPVDPWRGDPPVRLAGRLVVEFALRFTEAPLEEFGDPVTTLTFLEIIHANTEGLADHEGGGAGIEAEAFVPDARRAPVSISGVAARLGAPAETVRRHVRRLCETGRCQRVVGGYIVPAEVLARNAALRFAESNFGNLNRMFATMSEAGVIAAWRAEGSLDRQLSRQKP